MASRTDLNVRRRGSALHRASDQERDSEGERRRTRQRAGGLLTQPALIRRHALSRR